MSLKLNDNGAEVAQLQGWLNRLITNLPPLAVDGKFGPNTKARVVAFQQQKRLFADGVVGALTLQAITLALQALGIVPAPATSGVVRPLNQSVLSIGGVNNLVPAPIPAISVISESTFKAAVPSNAPSFRTAAPTVGRLGIFAANKNGVDRAVILLLPAASTPDRVIICITQGFAQASATLDPLGWQDPLSAPFINFVLAKHVINRWGAQTLASRKQMAFVYIVRAKGKELGPFANDGPFVRQVLTEMASLTGNAFSFRTVEAFTFSSGIGDFNLFLNSLNGVFSVGAIYNIDPAHGTGATQLPGAVRKQFLSGMTSGPKPGFEFMGIDRWSNEPKFAQRASFPAPAQFNYLHNHCMPNYILHLALQTS